MEQMLEENRARLTGTILTELEFSHKTYGENFYLLTLGIVRKSGYEDRIPLMISERIIWNMDLQPGAVISVTGQIRTYNQQTDGKNHLIIVVFVKELDWAEEDAAMVNSIILEGYICKPPVRRTSPLGREICDIMLAVNRMYNKSDYIPCIAWGRNAVYAGELGVGEKISMEGRLQSRQYKKYDEEGQLLEKTAYEVSIMRME